MERFTVSDTSGIEQNLSVERLVNQDIGSSVWLSNHIGPKWAVLRFDWLVTLGCVWVAERYEQLCACRRYYFIGLISLDKQKAFTACERTRVA